MTLSHHRSSLLDGVRHGFFTRRGGVSSGIYDSLNCGPGSKDNPDHVLENRRRVAQCLGQENAPLLSLYQIHSAEVVTITEPWQQSHGPQADAMVTNVPGVILGVLTADCGPVLFADTKAGVIGAAHAGWKGAVSGILENTISTMERLGATRANIKACLGPSIHQASYEVSDDFMRIVCNHDSKAAPFFAEGRDNHKQFDLPAYSLHRLKKAGISHDHLRIDTYPAENDLFSYRRTTHLKEGDYGRQISAIVL